jgi:Domain of unknown function (DUF4747)
MVDQVIQEVGFLNIVATPHPDGVYARLIGRAAGFSVAFYGDQTGAITAPKAVGNENSLLQGQLVVWTDIDEDQPGIDKRKLSQVKLADMDFSVPENLGFNSRVFVYVFNTATHVMAIETRNEFGQTISPTRAKRIFDRLLSPPILGLDAEMVEVTVIPEDDALSQVLGLARLDRVDILVKRPNPDDISDVAAAVMADLLEQNAKSEERILSRASGTDGIELNDENMIRARVAANNGYVSSAGRDEDGEPDKRSTKEYPKIVRWIVDVGGSAASRVREAARSATSRAREP